MLGREGSHTEERIARLEDKDRTGPGGLPSPPLLLTHFYASALMIGMLSGTVLLSGIGDAAPA